MKQSTCSHRQQRNAAALNTEFTKIKKVHFLRQIEVQIRIEFELSLTQVQIEFDSWLLHCFFSAFKALLLLQYSRNFYACLTNWDARGIWNVVQQVYYLYYSLKLPLLCYSTTTTGPRKSAVCFLTEI